MGAWSSRIVRAFLAGAALAAAFMACAGSPERGEAGSAGDDETEIPSLPPLEGTNKFHRINAERTSQHLLSNGIPVILYADASKPVSCIRVTFKNAGQGPDEAKPGTGALCLELMSRGPATVTAEEMEAFLYENKVDSFVDTSNPDISAITMVCPSSRLERTLPLFTSSLTAPAMREEDFEALKIARLNGLATDDRTEAGRAISALRSSAFAGHPYATAPEGELRTAAGASIEDIKAWHQLNLTSDRMLIVAAGDFITEDILLHLENSLGGILSSKRESQSTPRWKVKPLFHPLETGEGTSSWIIGLLPAPRMDDADAPSFRVAGTVLTSLMRDRIPNEETDKPGVGSYYFDGWGSHFAIFIVESEDPLGAKTWIDQAIHAVHEELSPGGLSLDSPGGLSLGLTPLADSLESWKAKTLCLVYQYSGSVQALARGLGEAFIYTGRPEEYFLLDERISRTSPHAVKESALRWLSPGRGAWILVSTESTLGLIDEDAWVGPKDLD